MDTVPPEALRQVAARWAEADPNEANRREVDRLLDEDPAGLAATFGGRITFGTAGLRAPLGPGPRSMNAIVVAQTARAIGTWLEAGSVVVVGFDARHESLRFAQVAADVLALAGHQPQLLEGPAPTPLIAHQVGSPEADAGIVITASHNPATDNGMKIYAPSGSQIEDAEAAVIEARLNVDDLTVPAPLVIAIDTAERAAIEQRYLATIGTVVSSPPAQALRVAYTPMHGVGRDLAVAAMSAAGHKVDVVPSQAEPDPDFPTAPFPNPEEPGALDELLAHATRIDAGIALAHDPDADRLAVAIPSELHDSGWRPLTGDDVGAILAEHLLSQASAAGRSRCVVASTVVSSSLTAKVAAHYNAHHVTTATGFKHLSRAADNVDGELCFAYEEALGYAVHPAIRDKDGISAALALLECAALRPLDTVLAEVHERHDSHLTGQVSIRFESPHATAEMVAFVDGIRSSPPVTLAGFAVREVTDLGGVIVADLDHGDGTGRVCVRPSGTEPKVKIYLEAISPDSTRATEMLDELEAAVTAAWVPASDNPAS